MPPLMRPMTSVCPISQPFDAAVCRPPPRPPSRSGERLEDVDVPAAVVAVAAREVDLAETADRLVVRQEHARHAVAIALGTAANDQIRQTLEAFPGQEEEVA